MSSIYGTHAVIVFPHALIFRYLKSSARLDDETALRDPSPGLSRQELILGPIAVAGPAQTSPLDFRLLAPKQQAERDEEDAI